jgi:hypothetical protein
MLLANYQQGGLEGEALQEHSFCCSFLLAELAKTSSKKETVRGRRCGWRVSRIVYAATAIAGFRIILESSIVLRIASKGSQPL